MKVRSGFVSNSSSSSFVAFIPKDKTKEFVDLIEDKELQKAVKSSLKKSNNGYVKYYRYSTEDYDSITEGMPEKDDGREWWQIVEEYNAMLNKFESAVMKDKDCFSHYSDC